MVREAFLCSLATIYFMESKQLSAILLSKITHRKGEGKQSNIEIQFCSCNILLPGIRRGKHFHLCLFKVYTIFPRYVFKYKSGTTICYLNQFNSTYASISCKVIYSKYIKGISFMTRSENFEERHISM